MEDFFIGLVMVLIFMVIIFLVCRHWVCWYWKINARVNLLENISDNMKQINNQLDTNKQLLNAINILNDSLASICVDIADIKKLSDTKLYVPTSSMDQAESVSPLKQSINLTDGMSLVSEYIIVQDELPEI